MLLQLPYFEIVCLILDEINGTVTILQNKFLFKKSQRRFNIKELNYTFQLEYAGLPTKEYVFSIFERRRRILKIRANIFGYYQLRKFVNDLDTVKKNETDK